MYDILDDAPTGVISAVRFYQAIPLKAWLGSARLGSAWLGSARLGSARLGSARLGSARLGSALPSTAAACGRWLHVGADHYRSAATSQASARKVAMRRAAWVRAEWFPLGRAGGKEIVITDKFFWIVVCQRSP